MRQLVAPLFDKATQAVAVGSRPALIGDGADVTSWYSSNASGPWALVMLDGSVAANLVGPGGAGAVELWGLFPFAGGPLTDANGNHYQWFQIGVLFAGAQISIVDAAHGYAEEFRHVGVARRLAVAATVSAGAVTSTFVPLETNEL